MPIQWLLQPGVWFVNLFVRPLLLLIGIRPEENTELQTLSPEEIRTLVLESSSFMPKKHFSILMNLFDVGAVTVQDIMVPRARIESIKLDDDIDTIVHQLATSYHQRLPVFRSALGEVVGVLHLKKVLAALPTGTLDKPSARVHARRALLRAGERRRCSPRCSTSRRTRSASRWWWTSTAS